MVHFHIWALSPSLLISPFTFFAIDKRVVSAVFQEIINDPALVALYIRIQGSLLTIAVIFVLVVVIVIVVVILVLLGTVTSIVIMHVAVAAQPSGSVIISVLVVLLVLPSSSLILCHFVTC